MNKAILLYSTQDTKQRNNAILLLTELANSETAFRDKDILFALDDLVNGCQMPLLLCQKLRALWDKALKDAPLEEGFALEAFESRFLASDYELAQKVSFASCSASRSSNRLPVCPESIEARSCLAYEVDRRHSSPSTVSN